VLEQAKSVRVSHVAQEHLLHIIQAQLAVVGSCHRPKAQVELVGPGCACHRFLDRCGLVVSRHEESAFWVDHSRQMRRRHDCGLELRLCGLRSIENLISRALVVEQGEEVVSNASISEARDHIYRHSLVLWQSRLELLCTRCVHEGILEREIAVLERLRGTAPINGEMLTAVLNEWPSGSVLESLQFL